MSKIQSRIDSFFIESRDFNGIPLLQLQTETRLKSEELIDEIEIGISQDRISVQWDVNPHIIRLGHYPPDKQRDFIRERPLSDACAYPTESRMRQNRDTTEFDNRPYTKRLANAEPQLKPVFFQMDVLEKYAFDPRYIFKVEGYEGHIHLHDEYFDGSSMSEHDKILIDTFGIGHTVGLRRRVVCVYLRYLKDLSPEHQQYWKTKEVSQECYPFYYYFANTALGSWEFCETLFTAFIKALNEINHLSFFLYKKKLFRKSFDHETPEGFCYLLSPTQKNFQDFILLLDKMISENLDKDFFVGKVELEYEEPISENKVKVIPKNTITLLHEWLKTLLKASNDKELSRLIIDPLKRIRRLRQDPAHRIVENKYDPQLIDRQTVIMSEVANSLGNIQMILKDLPGARGFSGDLTDFKTLDIYRI